MPFLTKNMDLKPPLRLSSWRKIALGTWETAGDPSVYGILDIDAEPAINYIQKLREKTGQRITFSHFAGKAVAETLNRHPQMNCVLRWGKLYPRKTVDVFFQVACDGQDENLSRMTVRSEETKSITDISKEMEDRVRAIREKRDQSYTKMKKNMGDLPGILSGLAIKLTGFFLYSLNLYTPLLGTPRDSFGSVMITNIGSLGLDTAFAPLVPFSRVPLLIALGNTRDAPVVKNGQVVPAKLIRLCVTLDHRVIDGMYASHMAKTVQQIFLNPEKELGPV